VRAAIVGLAGPTLDPDERIWLAHAQPLGVILFHRNCVAPEQVRNLVADVRERLGRPDAPILIDQEGGRVARLKPPAWSARPPLRALGRLAERDLALGLEAAHLHARLLASDLAPLGITVDCAPLLDLAIPGRTAAIGDRALAADPELVAALGRAMLDGFLEGGILPVIKHLPGHGRATADSHVTLPVVAAPRTTLAASDWQPFRACASAPFAMTAHVRYPALDPDQPATLSARIVEDVIRGEIGFAGALMSDDLCMGALGGEPGARAAGAIAAGCDLALHCSGVLAHARAVLEAVPRLTGGPLARVEHALARRRPPAPFDVAAGEARLACLLAGAATPHA